MTSLALTNGGNFSLTAANATVTLTNSISLSGNGVISVTQNTSALELDGVISGSSSTLNINGGASSGGVVILTANNTYSGGTHIQNSALAVTGASSLGTSDVTVASGGIFELFGQSISGHALTLNGAGFSGVGALVSVTANSTWGGNVTLATNSSIGGSTTLAITGNVSGSNTLTKLGANTLALSGNNTWSGGTNIALGTLLLNSSTALPLNTSLTLGSGTGSGVLDLNGQGVTVSGLAVAGSGSSNSIGSSSITATSTLTFSTGTSTFSGVIKDVIGNGNQTVALAIAGGSLTLSGVNTYSGGTQVNGGTLILGNNAALGSASAVTSVAPGGTLNLNGKTTTGQGLILSGAGVAAVGSLVNTSTTGASWSGNISLASNTTIAAGGAITLSGSITENVGPYGLTKAGTSTLTLSGSANNWSGGTFVLAGTLKTGSAGALPSTTTITLGNGTASGTLDLAGSNITVGGLATAGSASSIIGSSSTAANSALTFAGGTSTFGGKIQDTLGIGNQTVAVAVGSGNLTLSANNTYSGGTVISNGTLAITNITGSATGTGNVTLNGGTLVGKGTISGQVLAGSGAHTINAGGSGSVATLTIGGLSTNANTTLGFDLATPTGTSDLLAVGGNLTLSGGTLAITSHTTGNTSLGYYKVISYSGTLSGSTSGITLPPVANNVSYTLDSSQDPGYIDIHRGSIGDATDNGAVDLNDLNTVLNNLGVTTNSWLLGNFDGFSTIDLNDLNDVLNNLGTNVGTNSIVRGGSSGNVAAEIRTLRHMIAGFNNVPTAAEIAQIQSYAESVGLETPKGSGMSASLALGASVQPVPEPASLALLGMGTGLLTMRRRR